MRTVLGLGLGAAALGLFGAAIAPAASKPALKIANAKIEPLNFAALDGWAEDDHAAAFATFLKSCGAIRHGSKAMRAARPVYGALYEVCQRAAAAGTLDRAQARKFFEQNFQPVHIAPLGGSEGFLTGYYEPVVVGARVPNDEFKYPLYAKPSNLQMPKARKGKVGRKVGRRKVVPYYDRTEIEEGAIAGRGLEICYVRNPVDAFFAQIQGSTRVKLEDGGLLRLNYDAHNGLPYTPVGKFLIERGIVSKDEMSMDRIREFMESNPQEGLELRRKNRSFVFFREVPLSATDECIGAQGVALTPWRSVAVDKSLHVYGTPLWIEAELPIDGEKGETPFRRLMVAQDTGSAIVGPARADIYFGAGDEVASLAGRIKHNGRFVMLAPRSLALEDIDEAKIPLPRAKPAGAENAVEDAVEAKPDRHSFAPVPKPRPRT